MDLYELPSSLRWNLWEIVFREIALHIVIVQSILLLTTHFIEIIQKSVWRTVITHSVLKLISFCDKEPWAVWGRRIWREHLYSVQFRRDATFSCFAESFDLDLFFFFFLLMSFYWSTFFFKMFTLPSGKMWEMGGCHSAQAETWVCSALTLLTWDHQDQNIPTGSPWLDILRSMS